MKKPARRTVAWLLGSAILISAIAACWPFYAPAIANALIREDPLQRSDAILILGSARIERTYEAGLLYREGWAARIILSPHDERRTRRIMNQVGVRLPTWSEYQRSALAQMNVPSHAISSFAQVAPNTAGEAKLLTEIAVRENLDRVIIVTSRYHTLRAQRYFRKAAGDRYEVVVRASRVDPSSPDRWWTSTTDVIDVILEYLKLVKSLTYSDEDLQPEPPE